MTDEQLQIIANLTVELVRLRQNSCSNLCIENVAPKLFGDLVRELNRPEVVEAAGSESPMKFRFLEEGVDRGANSQ